ncbi:MAG: hypothetical protein EOP86_10235 [Verrucomicrobiaceae bacterium]|nr:MAG: hypothetical protein EOP86_10235 [Verrucomicrobiaceae bacterium]
MNTSLLLWDHSAWAGWILQSAAVSLALSLAGLTAAALTRRWHPSLRCLILTVFIAAPAVVLTTGFPFPAIGRTVNAPAGQGAGLTGDPGRAGASHRERTMGISIFQRHTVGNLGSGADYWRLPEAVRAGIHAAGLVWLAGSGLALCLALPGGRRLRSWRRGARRERPFEGIPVLVSDPCPQPMCAGLRRPVILLPAWFMDLPASQRAAALRHEAAHIRHGDLRLLLLQRIMAGLFWWNPLQRRLSRRLDTALEERADQSVLRAGTPVADYAQCLLSCAGRISAGPSLPATAGLGLAMAKSAPAAKTRILALLSQGCLASPGRIRRGACLLGAVAVALSVCMLTPSPVFAEPPAADSNKPLSIPAEPATPESQAKEVSPSDPVGQPANQAPTGKPPASSMDESMAKLLQVMEAYGKFSGGSAKPGSPSTTVTADRLTAGLGNTMTLQGHVRIELSHVVLEAEHVVIDSSRNSPGKEMAGAVITAIGKFTLTTKNGVIQGSQEDSKLEIPEHGRASFNKCSVRVLPTPP